MMLVLMLVMMLFVNCDVMILVVALVMILVVISACHLLSRKVVYDGSGDVGHDVDCDVVMSVEIS